MEAEKRKIILIGNPNVGKSMVFNYLTGLYATVSNYPGTTVDVTRGRMRLNGVRFEVVDTPGIYSLIPTSEEEQVTRRLLFEEHPDLVIHIVDAKNIRRSLRMTLQLLDAGFRVLLQLNMMDEAQKAGRRINIRILQERLGIPVVATSAAEGYGLKELKQQILLWKTIAARPVLLSPDIEQVIARISAQLDFVDQLSKKGMTKRIIAVLLLERDAGMQKLILSRPGGVRVRKELEQCAGLYPQGMEFLLTVQRQAEVDRLLEHCIRQEGGESHPFHDKVNRWTREPFTGAVVLIFVIYLGLYQFVGRFGAGYLVDYMNQEVFGDFLLPLLQALIDKYIELDWLKSLLMGEYGVITLGFRYAAAIILPVVGTFFLAFALLEDSGYLPRLALLLNNMFKWFGLNGRAVIPLTLGFGCGTMAVMVTRTLETRRERLLATFLLALAIPCSAQLGVVLAILSGSPRILLLWLGCLLFIFGLFGYISARIIPGQANAFYLEIPPLRMPRLSNVFLKAWTRMEMYFVEIVPIFVVVSCSLWLADELMLLERWISLMRPVMSLMGLPPVMGQVFLLGFFRRDYGTAGLFDLCAKGLLNEGQLLTAAVSLTVFVPCIAQTVMMVKERGFLVSLAILLVVALIALGSGWLVHFLYSILGF
ncbi:ferrous iron transport protein B [Acetonema longum]|uniref:Ferrous iron transport protein B n=1 Tax=Acetonema longum DSM 6540 TaxID=1009370 RepID=F7NPY3_9FIRM|nr:ferrous iron transport protein B [Acetonema longum]EGO61974.1 ferrous iron transport protein B [Acetonema longum DSM 6540]